MNRPLTVCVVFAHPDRDSFSRAVLEACLDGLRTAGHRVHPIDLYALDYAPGLSADEWRAYATDSPILDPLVAEHARLVAEADALVFVYPTWWSSVPAVLKSWFERTLVPGVAFDLDPRTQRVKPALTNVRHLVGITTYGSPWWYVKAVNDAGRRTILRTLRLATGRGTRCSWLALYSLDGRTDEHRRRFVERVRSKMAELS